MDYHIIVSNLRLLSSIGDGELAAANGNQIIKKIPKSQTDKQNLIKLIDDTFENALSLIKTDQELASLYPKALNKLPTLQKNFREKKNKATAISINLLFLRYRTAGQVDSQPSQPPPVMRSFSCIHLKASSASDQSEADQSINDLLRASLTRRRSSLLHLKSDDDTESDEDQESASKINKEVSDNYIKKQEGAEKAQAAKRSAWQNRERRTSGAIKAAKKKEETVSSDEHRNSLTHAILNRTTILRRVTVTHAQNIHAEVEAAKSAASPEKDVQSSKYFSSNPLFNALSGKIARGFKREKQPAAKDGVNSAINKGGGFRKMEISGDKKTTSPQTTEDHLKAIREAVLRKKEPVKSVPQTDASPASPADGTVEAPLEEITTLSSSSASSPLTSPPEAKDSILEASAEPQQSVETPKDPSPKAEAQAKPSDGLFARFTSLFSFRKDSAQPATATALVAEPSSISQTEEKLAGIEDFELITVETDKPAN